MDFLYIWKLACEKLGLGPEEKIVVLALKTKPANESSLSRRHMVGIAISDQDHVEPEIYPDIIRAGCFRERKGSMIVAQTLAAGLTAGLEDRRHRRGRNHFHRGAPVIVFFHDANFDCARLDRELPDAISELKGEAREEVELDHIAVNAEQRSRYHEGRIESQQGFLGTE